MEAHRVHCPEVTGSNPVTATNNKEYKMNIKLLQDFGTLHGVDWRVLHAILMTESGGKGFDDKGKMKSRFEAGIYSGLCKVKTGQAAKHPSLPGLDPAWIKQRDDHELYLMSASFGIAQIMGWHYASIGYKTVSDMVQDYGESEDNQIKSFLLFVLGYNKGQFMKSLKAYDWRGIARQYNGGGFERNQYDVKLKKYFKAISR